MSKRRSRAVPVLGMRRVVPDLRESLDSARHVEGERTKRGHPRFTPRIPRFRRSLVLVAPETFAPSATSSPNSSGRG